jgi:hypothetical protein
MTDRHSGYIVILDHDVRSDDTTYIMNAIAMIKGVLSVEPIIDRDAGILIAQTRE